MPEFRVVKRGDVPVLNQKRPDIPHVRLSKAHTLLLSVKATELLSNFQECRLLIEYDEDANTLKLSNPERLPAGVAIEDCFPMHLNRGQKASHRPMGAVAIRALLRYIGYTGNGGSVELPVQSADRQTRSLSLALPSL